MVSARENCPASSMTSRSSEPAGTRLSLTKSHAVPPMTQPPLRPPVLGRGARRSRPGAAGGRRRRPGLLADQRRVERPRRRPCPACSRSYAWLWATTPTFQPCCSTSRVMTWAPVVGLAGAGRALHRQVRAVEALEPRRRWHRSTRVAGCAEHATAGRRGGRRWSRSSAGWAASSPPGPTWVEAISRMDGPSACRRLRPPALIADGNRVVLGLEHLDAGGQRLGERDARPGRPPAPPCRARRRPAPVGADRLT